MANALVKNSTLTELNLVSRYAGDEKAKNWALILKPVSGQYPASSSEGKPFLTPKPQNPKTPKPPSHNAWYNINIQWSLIFIIIM